MSCDLHNNNNQYRWYFNQSLPVSYTIGSSYRSPHSGRTHPHMAYGYHDPNERV